MNNARRDAEWLAANRPNELKAHDIVRNPAHYTEGRAYEPIDVIEDWELPFHLGNALKYIARAGRKDASLIRQDISKAIWYLERFNDQFVEPEAQAKDADELIAAKFKDFRDEFNAAMDQIDAASFVPFDATDMVDLTMDQEEIEFEAMGEAAAINGIPSSILPGPDDVIYLGNYKKDLTKFGEEEIFSTYEQDGQIVGVSKNGKRTVLNDGVGGGASTDRIYEDIIQFEEWEDDDPWKHLADH